MKAITSNVIAVLFLPTLALATSAGNAVAAGATAGASAGATGGASAGATGSGAGTSGASAGATGGAGVGATGGVGVGASGVSAGATGGAGVGATGQQHDGNDRDEKCDSGSKFVGWTRDRSRGAGLVARRAPSLTQAILKSVATDSVIR